MNPDDAADALLEIERDVALLAQNEIYHRTLIIRAADALAALYQLKPSPHLVPELIGELRKAAK
jgi:hypothetical protein